MYQLFTVYKRRRKNKRTYIYYILFRDAKGNRQGGKSSGKSTRAEAIAWAQAYLEQTTNPVDTNLTFEGFAGGWFLWETCPFIKRKQDRGDYSRSYAAWQRTMLTTLIMPYFGPRLLHILRAQDIESWLLEVKASRSVASANRGLSVLKVMMAEVARRGLIESNPAAAVEKLKEVPKPKGILTVAEVRTLFSPDALQEVWDGDDTHFLLNLVAATTDLRMGEVMALRVQDIEDGYLRVAHSWDRSFGLKEPKTKSFRVVSLPSFVIGLTKHFIEHTIPDDDKALIFHGQDLYSTRYTYLDNCLSLVKTSRKCYSIIIPTII